MFNNLQISLRLIIYLFIGGGFVVYYSYKKIKRKNNLKLTPKQLLSSASAGSVEVEGIAWPFRAIESSMGGERIVFRQIVIKKYVRRGKSSSWKTVWTKNSSTPFMIFDQSGFVIINPDMPEHLIEIEELNSTEYRGHKLTNSQVESFYEMYDNSLSGFSLKGNQGFFSSFFSSSSSYKIIESVVPLGSPLLLHGFLVPEDKFRYVHLEKDQMLYFERACKLLKNKNYRKAFFDKNRDGEVDEVELQKGFKAAFAMSLKKEPGITNVMENGPSETRICGMMVSTTEQPLIFCHSFEEQFLKSRPVHWNWLALYAGGLMIAAAVFLFLNYRVIP